MLQTITVCTQNNYISNSISHTSYYLFIQTKEMEKTVIKSILAGILTIVFTCGASALEITRYVKPGGTGRGTTWADACGSINEALAAIKTAGSGTIYIGPGNYTESVKIPDGGKNIKILGGYSEENMDNPQKDKVFLSADRYDITKTTNAALEVGWNCESINIKGINVVKGATGIHLRGTNIFVSNCIVSGCQTGITNDISRDSKHIILHSRIFNCSGVGMKLGNSDILFSDISDNKLGLNIQGCYVYCCKIFNNANVSSTTSGIASDAGGIQMSQCTVSRSIIDNNKCDGNGGGINVNGSGYHSFIFQCVIANNTARDGGGIYADEQVFVESSTIINNKAVRFGGGICIGKDGWNSVSEMTSSILWNNTANNVAQQYGIYNNKPFNMTYSAIQGGGLLPETDAQNGIIDISPKNVDDLKPCIALSKVVVFCGVSSTSEQAKQIHEQDYSLTAQSACIDKGGDFSHVEITQLGIVVGTLNADRSKDMNFNPRTDGKYDIGALEFLKSIPDN
jgi:hypothetical protein